MKSLLLCTWSWVLLLVLMGSERSIMGCLKEERMALLHIKAAFNYPNGSSLASWQDGDGDCCSWPRVVCDNTTFRVTELYLSFTRVSDDPWIIDAPLFLPLEELQVLYLGSNRISAINGSLHLKKLKELYLYGNNLQRAPSLYKQTSAEPQNVSFDQLSGVNLEVLDLSYNDLVNDALIDITRMTSLRILEIRECGLNASSKLLKGLCRLRNLEKLNIYQNELWGPLPSCMGNLTSLRSLDASGNNFGEAIPSCIGNLTSLRELNVGGNNFIGAIPSGIGNLTSLLELDVGGNDFSGAIPSDIGNLTSLRWLDVGRNNFSGAIPSGIGNLTSLCLLDVSDNNFSGAIPSSLLSNLKSLERIDFSGNAFEGSLSLASLANASNLTAFYLSGNRNRLQVNTEDPTWFPSFRLTKFDLSDCVLNKDANGVIPSFLKRQYDLEDVRLSHTGMTGNFPNWLWDNNANLEWIEIIGNNLSGAFHFPSNQTFYKTIQVDVSANRIDGELPSWNGFVLPYLKYLNFSYNLLKGRIPSSMGNLRQLESLDLSNNGFAGEIPETLGKNCISLHTLKLSSNNLQGQMLPRNSNLTSLGFLYMENNHFTGNISPDILNSPSLRVLDVSNNSLSGTLPNWIGDFQNLAVLTLSSNLLKGPLPLSFCNLHHLLLLDLSNNNIGPNIPHCVNVTVVRFLHLTNDTLSGHFPDFLSRASSIVTLDLRHNALSGEVPNWIGSLRSLKVLLLQGNHFEGSIPLDLCSLKSITMLDLSNNNLFGEIHSCLENLTFGIDRVSTNSTTPLGDWGQDDEDFVSISGFGLEEVNFRTKDRLESYKGNILKLMSGIDLSNNNLTGIIPLEIGYLSELRALNLSHNHLVGPIPKTFSNLQNVESLDLSYNNLTGPIPPQLTVLYALSKFKVGHNNLSGRIPDRKNQFGTFDEASYEGNPLLCGAPLTSCDDSNEKQGTSPSLNHTKDDDSWREAFLWSFAGSYVVAFLGVVLFLYLNSYYLSVLIERVRKLIPLFPH